MARQSLAFQQLAGLARRGELRDYGEELTAESYQASLHQQWDEMGWAAVD